MSLKKLNFKLDLLEEKSFITKVVNKNFIILPEYENRVFYVYNGSFHVKLRINKKMIGFRFGEFIYTRKRHFFKKINNKKINFKKTNSKKTSNIKKNFPKLLTYKKY